MSAPAQRRLYEYVNCKQLAEAKELAASVVRIQVCRATRLRKKHRKHNAELKGQKKCFFFWFFFQNMTVTLSEQVEAEQIKLDGNKKGSRSGQKRQRGVFLRG